MTAPLDPYSFRVPKDGHAMRRSVAEAIDAANIKGVKGVVPDPRAGEVVYVRCSRELWRAILAKAALHSGNERKGDRRAKLYEK